jgi:hypothetical protein
LATSGTRVGRVLGAAARCRLLDRLNVNDQESNPMKKISMMQLAFAATLLTTACGKKEPENAEGPMEAAGEEADKAAADVSEASEETAEDADDKVEEAGDKIEEKTDK